MQRKPTPQSRGKNSREDAFVDWLVDRSVCAACSVCGPGIVHHVEGSAFKKKVNLVTVLLGHWYVLFLCKQCDDVVTFGSRREFNNKFGPSPDLWDLQAQDYPKEIPFEIIHGIANADDRERF